MTKLQREKIQKTEKIRLDIHVIFNYLNKNREF